MLQVSSLPFVTITSNRLLKERLQLAKQNGLLVSFDPNIRLKLWSKEEAKEFIHDLLPDVDILLTGEDEAEIILGSMIH